MMRQIRGDLGARSGQHRPMLLHATTARVASACALLLLACNRDSSQPASSEPAHSEPAPPRSSATPPVPAAPPPGTAPPDAESDQPELVPPGSPIIPLRQVELAVYLPSPTTPAFVEGVVQKVKTRFPGLTLMTKPEPAPPPTVVVFAPEMERFDLPGAAELAGYARDLRPAEVAAAAASKGAVLFGWLLDADPKFAEIRKANDLVFEVAQKSNGFVWDEGSHELFSAQSWKSLRVDGWQGDLPDARRHYTAHLFGSDKGAGRARAVTLGLAKLGLPDLVVPDVPVMQSAAVVTLMGAVAQLLAEGAAVEAEGRLTVDVKAMRHAAARAALVAAAAPNAPLHGTVTLAAVEPEEGDAENRLAEVRFDGYPGATEEERESAGVHAIVGAVPEQMAGKEAADPQFKAIAQRAQARVPALATLFQKGLPAGAELYVKAPVAPEGESFEWRWISVAQWKGATVRGILAPDGDGISPPSEPLATPGHEMGGRVEVQQSWIADYLLHKADGTEEGGESLKGAASRGAAKK